MNQPPENEVCSICHGNFSAPCQANCSHWFCGTISNPCTLSNLRSVASIKLSLLNHPQPILVEIEFFELFMFRIVNSSFE